MQIFLRQQHKTNDNDDKPLITWKSLINNHQDAMPKYDLNTN